VALCRACLPLPHAWLMELIGRALHAYPHYVVMQLIRAFLRPQRSIPSQSPPLPYFTDEWQGLRHALLMPHVVSNIFMQLQLIPEPNQNYPNKCARKSLPWESKEFQATYRETIKLDHGRSTRIVSSQCNHRNQSPTYCAL
jgi:hypothetical protein